MELKTKRARVMSAKYPPSHTEKIRPVSGVSTHNYKQELIQNIYTSQSVHPARGASAKTQTYGRYSLLMDNPDKKMQRLTPRQSRPKQQMVQEIHNLKQTINRLSEQLSQQKGKVEIMKRKNSKYSKVLTMEFENEQQWGSHTVSSHLVTGIKAMYDNLKEKFENKSRYCEWLTSKIETTTFLQMNSYIEILQKSNKDLMKQLQLIMNNNMQLPMSTESQKMAASYTLNELKFQNQTLTQRIKNLEASLKNNKLNSKDMDKKIQFLQKLMIQKDNNLHASNKKLKQNIIQIKSLKEELSGEKEKYANLLEQYNKDKKLGQCELNELVSKYEKQLNEALEKKNIVINILEQKNEQNQSTINQLRKNNIQLKSQLQNIEEEKLRLFYRNSQQPAGSKVKQTPIKQSKTEAKLKAEVIVQRKDGIKQPQRADKRHSQQAQKKRKVQQVDITHIAELIRYKLIAKNIQLQQFKCLFDPKQNKSSIPSQEYISMEQVLHILLKEPLNLAKEPATLLARYLIEDVNAEYVYCDLKNQNYLEVIKSIINKLISHYNISNAQKINNQCQRIIEQYGSNLHSNLTALYKSGYISKDKFEAILNSLGIEMSIEAREAFIGKMAVSSSDINELPYEHLFD